MPNFFVLLVYSPHLFLDFGNIVFRLQEDRLIVLEVTFEALILIRDLPNLLLHVENLRVDLVRSAVTIRDACLGHSLLKIALQLHLLLLVELNLCAQIFSVLRVPLCHLAMRDLQLALNVRIFIVLRQAALMKWSSCLLLGQATLDDIQLAHTVLDYIILFAQVFALVPQVSLHI